MSLIAKSPIIVVEDSDEDFDTVIEAVAQASIEAEVWRATTGEEFLALLRGVAAVTPAMVLLDLNTPGTDGREALAIMKSDPALCAVPVVVFSTSANPRDLDFCYRVGANAYHVKPIRHPDHLDAVIDIFRYWLGRVALQHSGRTVL